MRASRIIHLVWIVIAVVSAAGCGASAPARFYTLSSTAMSSEVPTARYAVLVGPVSVPASVDRPQFVVQVAANRVELDEFNRWAAPLNDGIGRAVAGNLAILLGTTDVATAPVTNFDPTYRVTIDVQRFESVPGESVLIDAVWAVHAVAKGTTRSGRSTAREALQGTDFDAIPAAHSRALASVSADIAAAIQAVAAAEETPTPEKPSGTRAKKRK
jgi:uncharacterized lipoprotein YmbA